MKGVSDNHAQKNKQTKGNKDDLKKPIQVLQLNKKDYSSKKDNPNNENPNSNEELKGEIDEIKSKFTQEEKKFEKANNKSLEANDRYQINLEKPLTHTLKK